MATNKQILTVQSEDQAIAYLEDALASQLADTGISLNFEGWPTLSLVYTGDKFHGTITPNIAKALIELQDAMNRTYMMAVHDTLDLTGLGEDVKRELQLEAAVDEGSSLINIDMGDWAAKLTTELVAKMTGPEVVITVLGVATVLTAGFVASKWLKNRSEEKTAKMQQETIFHERETDIRKMEVMARAINKSPAVREAETMADDVRNAFVRSAIDADTFTYQDSVTLTGADAKQLYRAARRPSKDVQLNGNYMVESFTWAADGNTATVRVTSIEQPDLTFSAELSVITLNKEQRDRFKDSAFDRERVYLNINAKMLNDRVNSAKIVSVDLQPDTAPPKE